jgi:hypothetical protein
MTTEAKNLQKEDNLVSELLILPDGQILVHNLTEPFAKVLSELNPECDQINSRLNTGSDAAQGKNYTP